MANLVLTTCQPVIIYLHSLMTDMGILVKTSSVQPGETSPCFVGMQPVKPKLAVSRSELNFGTTETNLSFQLTNIGKGELKWEVKESIDWLSVNPSSGDNFIGDVISFSNY